MRVKQSVQRVWNHFWWHPIVGPVVPMGTVIVVGIWALYALGLTAEAGTTPVSFNDVDCRDFATRAEAQVFFEAHRAGDPHWLDFDGDGRACELSRR